MKNEKAAIMQGLSWLENEKRKDQIEIDINKEKLIKNIKSIKKETMFPPKKEKQSFFNKILKILNNGKKR